MFSSWDTTTGLYMGTTGIAIYCGWDWLHVCLIAVYNNSLKKANNIVFSLSCGALKYEGIFQLISRPEEGMEKSPEVINFSLENIDCYIYAVLKRI